MLNSHETDKPFRNQTERPFFNNSQLNSPTDFGSTHHFLSVTPKQLINIPQQPNTSQRQFNNYFNKTQNISSNKKLVKYKTVGKHNDFINKMAEMGYIKPPVRQNNQKKIEDARSVDSFENEYQCPVCMEIGI